MRRFFVLIGLVGLIALVLFACSTATQATASPASDDFIQKLIGEWEGTVSPAGAQGPWRTLIIKERDGKLTGLYGVTFRTLLPVDITADAETGKISFHTPAWSTVTLLGSSGN